MHWGGVGGISAEYSVSVYVYMLPQLRVVILLQIFTPGFNSLHLIYFFFIFFDMANSRDHNKYVPTFFNCQEFAELLSK